MSSDTMERQEPIPVKLLLVETLRFVLITIGSIAIAPLALAVTTHWALGNDGAWFPWPIDAGVWWQGFLRMPAVLVICFIPWIGVQLSEASPYFLLCCWWVAFPWWCLRWLVRNHLALVLRWTAILSVAVPVGPLLIAWGHKLAWYIGNWWATGEWDTEHVFVREYSDSFLAAAEGLKLTKFMDSVEPYRTAGMWPDRDHWVMGAFHTVQCMGVVCAFLAIGMPIYFAWCHIVAQARRRVNKRE